jgi:membrane protease YdiL (CAAX protease family)
LLLLFSLILSSPVAFFTKIVDVDSFELLVGLALCTTFTIISFFAFKFHGEVLFSKSLFTLKIRLHSILLIAGFQLLINVPLVYFIDTLADRTPDTSYSWIYLGATILLGPFIEEWIFRGCFLRGLLSSCSPKKAIIISAILFSLVHANPNQMFGALVLGLYFGYVYTKTNSVLTTALLHGIANACGLLGIYLLRLI